MTQRQPTLNLTSSLLSTKYGLTKYVFDQQTDGWVAQW